MWTLRKRLMNFGPWVSFGPFPNVGFKTPLGNLIIKGWGDRLFSERYGFSPGLRVGPIFIRWVRLRNFSTRKPDGPV